MASRDKWTDRVLDILPFYAQDLQCLVSFPEFVWSNLERVLEYKEIVIQAELVQIRSNLNLVRVLSDPSILATAAACAKATTTIGWSTSTATSERRATTTPTTTTLATKLTVMTLLGT